MCGIFGYIGPQNAIEMTLKGLKFLEYRGYDSSGIAGILHGELVSFKTVGKIAVLENLMEGYKDSLPIAIAHTRWATHGGITQDNAHPQYDTHHTLAVVHNGIIENYATLKDFLKQQGFSFNSETDTEVIANLIAYFYEGDLRKAVQKTVGMLEGAYAVAVIHRDQPEEIVAFARECPLTIGIGNSEAFLSSDPNAFADKTQEVIFLQHGEVAVITSEKIEVYGEHHAPLDKPVQKLNGEVISINKGEFDHYTLKEIYEQPQAIRQALANRCNEEYGTAVLDTLRFSAQELLSVQRILILACGTSWHAGYLGAYLLEDCARIPVQVEISSEFRYKNPVILPGTLVIAISQSGETADTIAAVRELKAKGSQILAICNVNSSTLVREAHSTLFLHAGPEIGVCSTKAFTSQVTLLALFALLMSRMRHMTKKEGREFISALKLLPEQVEQVLSQAGHIQEIARRYASYENFFFIGRNYMYPTALEGALKLKEISYINANAYAAGEMKHGPIALINAECPTVAFCANSLTQEKIASNMMEIKAREGKLIAIYKEGQEALGELADEQIKIASTSDRLACVPASVAAQLLAYYIALERGTDIDQPRNLAKSVTVE